MTLPELLISIAVLGLIVAVLSAGITVTLRQSADTRGRVDVSRWEQNLGMWFPDDLTSAQDLDETATQTPCGEHAATCGGIAMDGSNVLLATWEEDVTSTTTSTTIVSYRYQPDVEGTYGLFRIECVDGNCRKTRVLGDLSEPGPDWSPGDLVPTHIIDAEASGREVTITVNGDPMADGTQRTSTVRLAAAGVALGDLPDPTFTRPTFNWSASDCGGPITIVVDTSGSIGDDMNSVIDGVQAFVLSLDTTPTRLQIIPFSNRSSVIVPHGTTGDPYHYYWDLSGEGKAAELAGLLESLTPDGSTNWEDALFRAIRMSDGTPLADPNHLTSPQPELVVFFTDGIPTVDRSTSTTHKSDIASTAPNEAVVPYDRTETYSRSSPLHVFSPQSWYRANELVGTVREGTRVIALGVGPEITKSRIVLKRAGGEWGVDTRQEVLFDDEVADGWPTTPVPHEQILGNWVGTGQPWQALNADDYEVREYNGSWGDISDADLLLSGDFTQFTTALEAIFVDECGSTLTVQTRDESGLPLADPVVYEVDDGVSAPTAQKPSPVTKLATFNIDLGTKSARDVELVPANLDSLGLIAKRWACRSGGTDLVLDSDFRLITSDPKDGIVVTVSASSAVSCSLIVAKP